MAVATGLSVGLLEAMESPTIWINLR